MEQALTNLEATLVKYQTEVNADLENFRLYSEHLSSAMQANFILSIIVSFLVGVIVLAIAKSYYSPKKALDAVAHLSLKVSSLESEIASLKSIIESMNTDAVTDFPIEDAEYDLIV